MEEISSVINNVARLILYAGGSVFTIAVCVAGFFYMTAFGDPQKQNVARGALVGAFVGIMIMGVSFLAPRVISNMVLEPAGLAGLANVEAGGCDGTLRKALVTHRSVGHGAQVNRMVATIHAQRAADCGRDVWMPFVLVNGAVPPGSSAALTTGGFNANCGIQSTVATVPSADIGNTEIPMSLFYVARSRQVGNTTNPYGSFARDAKGNILIQFHGNFRPTNGAECWLYVAEAGYWDYEA